MRALIITPTGEKDFVEFGEGTAPNSLTKLLDHAIGTAWEAITLRVDFAHGCDMWLDEEGKFKKLPQNPMATSLLTRSYGLHDFVVGTVVITGPADSQGATTGLTDEQITAFARYTDAVNVFSADTGLVYQ